jgi:hypothetical protein
LPGCHGARLNQIAFGSSTAFGKRQRLLEAVPSGLTIEAFGKLSVGAAFGVAQRLRFTGRAAAIARDILPLRDVSRFMVEVGLDYLQLDRSVTTSAAAKRRIRLAAQLGSSRRRLECWMSRIGCTRAITATPFRLSPITRARQLPLVMSTMKAYARRRLISLGLARAFTAVASWPAARWRNC